LLDATRLRKRGIHTVAIVWDVFEGAARAMAKLQGIPDLPILVIPQMAVGEDEDDQRRKAKGCLPNLVACWETSPGAGSDAGASATTSGSR
jgi:alkylation response protein AidB-like acyl-CoA dehydrogenase